MRISRDNVVHQMIAFALCLAGRDGVVVASPPVPVVATAKTTSPLVLALRSRVQVVGREILIADVAAVSGGNAAQRKRMEELDLNDALATGESIEIGSPQIEFRLRLAGFDSGEVSIRGSAVRITSGRAVSPTGRTTSDRDANAQAPSQHVRSSDSIATLEQLVAQAAEDCVRGKLPWSADDVVVRLAVPLPRELTQVTAASGYSCRTSLRTNGPAVGRIQVQVVAESPGEQSFDVAVHLDVRHFDGVVLAAKALERGHTIQAADVYVDRQDVTTLSDYCSNTDLLVGATVKRSVRPLRPVKLSDAESSRSAANAVLVKRRDRVRMVAKIGSHSISTTGEAQQEGRLGDTIRLQNIESKSFVQGRVTAANEVEITY